MVVELATCEEICRQSCYKRQVCVDVQALREERPGEWKENDTATDEAVTAQAGEVDTSITEITEYQERLQIALKEVEDKRAPLAENVSMKNTAEGVDASTLALKRGDGYDELPRSTLEPEAWVQQAEDLVQQTTDAIAHSVETRTEIHPLCVARVETEETCWQVSWMQPPYGMHIVLHLSPPRMHTQPLVCVPRPVPRPAPSGSRRVPSQQAARVERVSAGAHPGLSPAPAPVSCSCTLACLLLLHPAHCIPHVLQCASAVCPCPVTRSCLLCPTPDGLLQDLDSRMTAKIVLIEAQGGAGVGSGKLVAVQEG